MQVCRCTGSTFAYSLLCGMTCLTVMVDQMEVLDQPSLMVQVKS